MQPPVEDRQTGAHSTIEPPAQPRPAGGFRPWFRRPARWMCALAMLAVTGALLDVAEAAAMSDNFGSRPTLSGARALLDGTSVAATAEIGEPDHDGARRRTLWGAWVAPGNGNVVIDTLGSSFDPVVAVYSGNSLATLAPVARNRDIDGSIFPQARVVFPAKAGLAYVIAVDGQYANSSGVGAVVVNVAFTAASQPPAEVGADSFGARPTLTSGPAALGVANNRFATLETFEPARISARAGTVWWRWVAPGNGTVVMDSLASDFDTALTVYTGDDFGSLGEVAVSLDVPNRAQSQVTFQTRAGQEYQIMVDGQYGNASGYGNIVLQLAWAGNSFPGAVPGADDFSRRGRLAGSNAEGVAMNRFFGTEAFEPGHGSARGATAWWAWTAPATGSVRIRTEGSTRIEPGDMNTHLVVYTGNSFANLRSVAQNNDAPGALWSEVTFQAQRGVEYVILVDGFFGNATGYGNIRLRVDQAVAPDETLALYPSVELEIPGTLGLRYQLQGSPNLRDWSDVGAVLAGTGTPIRIFQPTRGSGHLYYRYRIVP